jgi:hypothetical protein
MIAMLTMIAEPTGLAGLDRVDGQGPAVDTPPRRGAQVFVVVAQVPHQVRVGRPVMGHAGDPAQRVAGVVAGGVHLADDRVLGPGDRLERRQRFTHTRATAMDTHRLERPRRVGKPQFCSLGEQFGHIGETAVVDCRGVQMHQVGEREPVGHREGHGSGGRPLLIRMSRRHCHLVWPVCSMQTWMGVSSSTV